MSINVKDTGSVDGLEAEDGVTLVQESEVNQSAGHKETMLNPDFEEKSFKVSEDTSAKTELEPSEVDSNATCPDYEENSFKVNEDTGAKTEIEPSEVDSDATCPDFEENTFKVNEDTGAKTEMEPSEVDSNATCMCQEESSSNENEDNTGNNDAESDDLFISADIAETKVLQSGDNLPKEDEGDNTQGFHSEFDPIERPPTPTERLKPTPQLVRKTKDANMKNFKDKVFKSPFYSGFVFKDAKGSSNTNNTFAWICYLIDSNSMGDMTQYLGSSKKSKVESEKSFCQYIWEEYKMFCKKNKEKMQYQDYISNWEDFILDNYRFITMDDLKHIYHVIFILRRDTTNVRTDLDMLCFLSCDMRIFMYIFSAANFDMASKVAVKVSCTEYDSLMDQRWQNFKKDIDSCRDDNLEFKTLIQKFTDWKKRAKKVHDQNLIEILKSRVGLIEKLLSSLEELEKIEDVDKFFKRKCQDDDTKESFNKIIEEILKSVEKKNWPNGFLFNLLHKILNKPNPESIFQSLEAQVLKSLKVAYFNSESISIENRIKVLKNLKGHYECLLPHLLQVRYP